MRRLGIVSLALVSASVWTGGEPAAAGSFELLAELVVPRQLAGSEAPVGGLSGLAYDPETNRYYAISDDRSQFGPARIYELEIELNEAVGGPGVVEVRRALSLRQADGTTFEFDSIDPESLARTSRGTWIVASEGRAEKGVAAALLEFDATGRWLAEFRLPRRFRPRPRSGIRNNLALESATVAPSGRWVFTAGEAALLQDGPEASASAGSASRLLRFDAESRRLAASYLYLTEPIAGPPRGGEFAVNGLVDLLALDDDRLLALERSFTVGQGNVARLFLIDLSGATNVRRVRRLGRRPALVPVTKEPLLDLSELGVEPDNLEGMAFGPRLADGRRTLVLVADDNFNPVLQANQVLVLALDCGAGKSSWRDCDPAQEAASFPRKE